ncbi:expressed unknown protein [Ectocarpus siliculosus]|uniref:Uncharacterized protein n=1 Tax=Ectocarpus siliculosus TaxID=2880 RepID=D7FXB7_ECTSI|nr:expressed unknown protein [Ectocarpus siliculosus]|eukprot:CBJ32254.1 expressed unknown protein [Ectocarpus siliculosus]
MGSNATNSNTGDGGAPDVSDMPYNMLGPVSRVYVSEAAWQAKTRAERQETLDLEPKLIEAALQQHQDNAEEAVRAQGQEAVDSEPTPAQAAEQQQHQHETAMEAMRARAEIRCAQIEMETVAHAARSSALTPARFNFDGTTVVTVRQREVQQVDGYANPYAYNAADAFQF